MADELLQYLNTSPFYAGFDLEEKVVRTKFLRNYEVLPIKLKELLTSETVAVKIEKLSQNYRLSNNQTILLAMIIRYTITGNLFIGEMPQELANRLGIDQAVAREIANQIVSQLFAPVLEDIKKVQNERYPGKLPTKPATPLEPAATKGGLPLTGQARPHYQGEDLPETGGNIIDLRSKS